MHTTRTLRKMTNSELIDHALQEDCDTLVKFELIRRLENLTIVYQDLLIVTDQYCSAIKSSITSHDQENNV